MSKVDKLLEKARNNPQGLRFSDLCRLTKAFGFEWVHGEGSHRVYGRAGVRQVLVFQPRKDGQAKAYQVQQLLDLIDQYKLEAR
jgi:predicted RNA binding protein YcfA (HicA-like mRNA interferase family)